jgi:hypothetical protein
VSWRTVLLIAGAGWLFLLVWLAERADLRERRRARSRQARLARFKDEDALTDEQADRLWQAIHEHPAGHTPRKRYYR